MKWGMASFFFSIYFTGLLYIKLKPHDFGAVFGLIGAMVAIIIYHMRNGISQQACTILK